MSEVPLYEGSNQCSRSQRTIPTGGRFEKSRQFESGPLRAVHLSRHKWPGGLVDQDSGRLSESTSLSSMV